MSKRALLLVALVLGGGLALALTVARDGPHHDPVPVIELEPSPVPPTATTSVPTTTVRPHTPRTAPAPPRAGQGTVAPVAPVAPPPGSAPARPPADDEDVGVEDQDDGHHD